MTNENPKISLVIPLYNEEEILPTLFERLDNLKLLFNFKLEFILVNDGSSDKTEELLIEKGLSDNSYQIVLLSRNFGHQLAYSAGLKYINGTDAVFLLDGDLQDPPELLVEFYDKFKLGYEVIYGVRKKRKESFLKRFAYLAFYRLLSRISMIELPLDSGDFSLISRRVANQINNMPEESRYLRGMRTWVGFKQTKLEYERASRQMGETKYSFSQLMKLAYNGIFNFSEFPIKFITNIGALSLVSTFIYIIYTLVYNFIYHDVPEGFTGLLVVTSLFGSTIILSLGIIGEYVTRIFFQSKNRPLYILKSRIINKKTTNE